MAADSVELRMNVAALKRVDPYIKDILGTATQVALYTFSTLKNEWEKTEVEGALFVCSRNGEPYNSILIMNRLNTNNLVEPIVKDLDWQMKVPFLLYRNSRNNIYGVWFYNRGECMKITSLLEQIMESLNNQQEKTKQRNMAGNDIFSMLSKAQQNFNKTPVKTENNLQVSQPQTSTPRAPDLTSQSVMEFFAKASTTKAHPPPPRMPVGEDQPLLQRIMTNPVHSVEHIEKQQRAVTPQDQQNNAGLHPKTNPSKSDANSTRSNGGGAGLLRMHSVSPGATRDVVPVAPLIPLGIELNNPPPMAENGTSFVRIESPTTSTSPRQSYFAPQPVVDDETRNLSPALTALIETPQKPALMPPTMFTSSLSAKEKLEVHPVPIAKSDFSPDQPEPLTRKQMAQAFHYLLKNDPEFLTKLHEAYVKSFAEMVS